MQTLDRRHFLKASGAGLMLVSFQFSELAQAAQTSGLAPAKSVAKEADRKSTRLNSSHT